MDSGINMDISSVSMGNISTELKDDTNVSLPVIPENEVSTCNYSLLNKFDLHTITNEKKTECIICFTKIFTCW